MSHKQQFNDWWEDFKSQYAEWPYADKEALLYQAYLAGTANTRDEALRLAREFAELAAEEYPLSTKTLIVAIDDALKGNQ